MQPVSSGNPCPFLRALVAEGLADNDVEPVRRLSQTITRVASTGEGEPSLPNYLTSLVLAAGNSLNPFKIVKSLGSNMSLSGLRDGPFDKHGAGSQVLDTESRVREKQLQSLEGFGSLKKLPDGQEEIGLDADEVSKLLKANWARAKGKRRPRYLLFMKLEWPILLKVMGKEGVNGRYLSAAEVRTLLYDCKLPDRMLSKL